MTDAVPFIHRYSRSIIRSLSVGVSLLIYLGIVSTIPAGTLRMTQLTQWYGLLAVFFLYVTLLASPVCCVFPQFPHKALYLYARRALGQSAWYFACLHASCSFFWLLGGFRGLTFLPSSYLFPVTLGLTALTCLSVMAATSFDAMEATVGYPRWKLLHRIVYGAGLCIIIHALLLGSHFSSFSSPLAQICLILLIGLLILESLRLDTYLRGLFRSLPLIGPSLMLTGIGVTVALVLLFLPSQSTGSWNIHSQHLQIARDAQKASQQSGTFAGLQGDRSQRFSVSFHHPDRITPGEPADLLFSVYNADTGNPVAVYTRIYEKLLHLVIVDSDLRYFSHIHPELTANGFTISPLFPHSGIYHLYLNFQPGGAIEQQFAFTVMVGDTIPERAPAPLDSVLTKSFDHYTVTLAYPTPLTAADLSTGQRTLTFTLIDTRTGQPVTNLFPYLGAFGHLVMIDEQTYTYVHVHPASLTLPAPGAIGGPTVAFTPLGLYGPIKPGIYRLFAQFNPGGTLITADYTIRVE